MRFYSAALLIVPSMVLAQPNPEGFVPGHVFVTQFYGEGCWIGQPEVIREIDPATGESWVLADSADGLCGPVALVFTPDCRRLRVANNLLSEIIEFDSAGNGRVIYTSAQRLSYPGGNNGMTFDRAGNFFVYNGGSREIVLFPADGSGPSVFADEDQGIEESGTLRFGPDGQLYMSQFQKILRFDEGGGATIFDSVIGDVVSLQFDRLGRLFAGVDHAQNPDVIYIYTDLMPQSRTPFAGFWRLSHAFVLGLSSDESQLYLVDSYRSDLVAIDTTDGTMDVILQFEPFTVVGTGLAVYVPPVAGDLNCDGSANAFDIEPFIAALSDPPAYDAQWPHCDAARADLNGDGSVNPFDIQPLIDLLSP